MRCSVLKPGSEWNMIVNLKQQRMFPHEITLVSWHPILWFNIVRTVIAAKLSVPLEKVRQQPMGGRSVSCLQQIQMQGGKHISNNWWQSAVVALMANTPNSSRRSSESLGSGRESSSNNWCWLERIKDLWVSYKRCREISLPLTDHLETS